VLSDGVIDVIDTRDGRPIVKRVWPGEGADIPTRTRAYALQGLARNSFFPFMS